MGSNSNFGTVAIGPEGLQIVAKYDGKTYYPSGSVNLGATGHFEYSLPEEQRASNEVNVIYLIFVGKERSAWGFPATIDTFMNSILSPEGKVPGETYQTQIKGVPLIAEIDPITLTGLEAAISAAKPSKRMCAIAALLKPIILGGN